MDESQNNQPRSHKVFTVLMVLVALVVIYAIYASFGREFSLENENNINNSANVSLAIFVENTIAADGVRVLAAPKGFPKEIPFESNQILESSVTHHPSKNTRQFTLDYLTSKIMTQKYNEYLNYMKQAGFEIKEEIGEVQSILSGVKRNVNLSITIKYVADDTLVQISHISPEVSE